MHKSGPKYCWRNKKHSNNQKKYEEQKWTKKNFEHSSLDKESRWEDPIRSYMPNTGVKEVSDPREEVAFETICQEVEIKAGCQIL